MKVLINQAIQTTGRDGYMKRVVAILLCIACLTGADTLESAIKKVREGLQHFRNQQFSDAETSFTEAQEIAPENAVILFDKACAAMAGNDAEQARGLFRSASHSKDAALAVKAHYNLGGLEADQARSKLSEDPAAAEGELREECVELLRTSIRHYRDALRLDRDHKDARHNLELVRLYIKHLESQWAERDKQKNREEKDLLQFLKMIEEQQTKIRGVTKALDGENSSVYLRQAAMETADSLRTLHEEIAPLKDKITEQIQASQQPAPGQPPGAAQAAPALSDEMQQAEQALHGIADQIGDKLLDAATKLEATDFSAGIQSQTDGLNTTNQLYMTIAPYQDVLQRALSQQQKIAPPEKPVSSENNNNNTAQPSGETKTETEAAEKNEDTATLPPEPSDDNPEPQQPVDPAKLLEDQTRITEWSSILALKAEAELPAAEQQLAGLQQAMPAEDAIDPNQTSQDEDEEIRIKIDPNLKPPVANKDDEPSEEEQAAAAEKQQMQQQLKQMEGLVESMKLAIEKAPQATEHSAAAVSALTASQQETAETEQTETLKILKEIAEPLKSDQQDNQDQNQEQDENQDDQQQDDQQQNEQDKDQENKDQQQQDQQPQDEEQEQQEQKQSDRQQAESMLRQAAEREKKHREDQKKLRALIMDRMKVDKDW